MDTGELPQADIDALAHRAHRRWIITMIVVVIVSGVSGALGGILGSHRHRTQTHHHTSVAGLIVGIVIIVISVGFLVWLFTHARKHKHGLFAPQLINGLKYSQRREVMRDVRSGSPSTDPLLRHVETSIAERTIRYQRFSMIVFGLAFLGETYNALARHNLAGHIFFSVAALVFVFLSVYQLRVVSGAKRYLNHAQIA